MNKSRNHDPSKPPPRRTHLFIATLGFIVFVVYGSLVPLQYQKLAWDEAIHRFRGVPYLRLGIASRADWVSNILLFIPLGFLSLGTLAVDRRRDLLSSFQAILIVICCSLASICIEFTQLWFPPRTVSQNDIIAESIGAAIGVLLWMLVGQTLIEWLRQYTAQQCQKRQIDWLLEAYFMGFLLYQVLPLDLTISVSELWEKIRLGRITLIPFADLQLSYVGFYGLFRDVVTCIPLGALVSLWRMPAGRVRRWSNSLIFGSLIVIGVEFAQLIIFSRFSSTTDLLMGILGVALGIALTRRLLQGQMLMTGDLPVQGANGHAMPKVLLSVGLGIVYSCFLVAIFCAPFDFTGDKAHIREAYEGIFSVPFSRLYHGTEFNAVSSSLANMFLFAPLGCIALVAAMGISDQRAHRWIILIIMWLLILSLALGIELLQVFLPTHFADVTEVIVRGLGSLLGIAITCRYAKQTHASQQRTQKTTTCL